jgi:hypothetical protein
MRSRAACVMAASRCALVLLAACSGHPTQTAMDVGACNGQLTMQDGLANNHVPIGTTVEYSNNPPIGGPHYPTWAAWNRAYPNLDRRYYVHNEEHGGVILLYRCDAGCPEVVDALLTAARNVAIDPLCSATVKRRIIVTADPLLPDGVQVAAAAWGHAYTASCYDPYIETFIRDNYAHAAENTCFDGEALGGTPID